MKRESSLPSLPANAVWQEFAGDGPAAHFYHANGFPAGLYRPLLTRLQQRFHLTALSMRPTWNNPGAPPQSRDWQIYASDLIAHLEHNSASPVVGIGHSMGAACTVMAAVRRPELFRSLILIEPVTTSRLSAVLLKVLPSVLVQQFDPIRSTLVRREVWPSREDFVADCRQHRAYRRFDDEALQALKDYGVTEDPDGQYRLAFPRSWEAHNYMQPPYLTPSLMALKMPCMVVRTRPSVFCSDSSWREWQARCPELISVENPDYGHLLPIESAAATEELIHQALDRLKQR